MKSRKRIVFRDILNHCYQRGANGFVLFYSVSDHLVYFTTYCLLAKKYNVKVLSLCQMPDHVHDSVVVKTAQQLATFRRELNSTFSRAQNEFCHWEGAVFESPFGSAPKQGAKKARTNLIYVGNNPVERRLVTRAEDYQWNYLAYAVTNHPFSEPLVIRNCRGPMKCAVKEVKAQYERGKPMTYPLLKRLFALLDLTEKRQLTDFIVSTYNVIDYAEAIRYFDSFEDMLTAMHANTGSEYDLNEITVGRSDIYFSQFAAILLKDGRFEDIHQILSLPKEQRVELFMRLRQRTGAMTEQIAHYLRLHVSKESIDETAD